ncbi:hypothetical protein SAMN05421819_1856 [Bryocella elongata]|uniref:Uncharacterized protein n=1 Tax=Bryocella elongata TaxID=863522 RepID=A0A1H5X3T1_9BACT|nr:hypothetical protein [Bryocella elongata]SEG06223.1 hypothetical protein SAMN05421819_1856 [Bryocella elongata]
MKKLMLFTPLIAVAMMTSVPMSSLAEKTAETNTAASNVKVDQNSLGYRNGVEAYQLDKLAGRQIGAKTSHLYKNPPVKSGPERDDYRAQFEAGYNATMNQGS